MLRRNSVYIGVIIWKYDILNGYGIKGYKRERLIYNEKVDRL